MCIRDRPRTLLPGAIATGAFGITMTAVPGTPQIQNLIPTDYYGTTTMAAPLLSLVACAVMLLPAYIYLEWRVRQSRRKGLHFVPEMCIRDRHSPRAFVHTQKA